MKLVSISCCGECVFCKHLVSDDKSQLYVNKYVCANEYLNNPKVIKEVWINEMPDWCPLESL